MALRHPALLLGLLLSACVIDKSVGDDPESQGVQDDAGNGSNSGNNNGDSDSTTSNTGSSASSTQGNTGTATPSYEECGVTIVPVEPSGPIYTDMATCAGGCVINIESGAPTGFQGSQEVGDCLCESIGCGGWTSESTTGADPTNPDSDSTTGSASCGYDPPTYEGPGEYAARCGCDECDVRFDDISPEDADVLLNDPSICECLCEAAGCGGLGVSVGEVGGGSSSGDSGDTTSTSG